MDGPNQGSRILHCIEKPWDCAEGGGTASGMKAGAHKLCVEDGYQRQQWSCPEVTLDSWAPLEFVVMGLHSL